MQTAGADGEVLALFKAGMKQSREPCQRHTKHAPVIQADIHAAIVERDLNSFKATLNQFP